MKRTPLSLLTVLLLIFALMCGCGKTSEPAPSDAPASSADIAPAPAETPAEAEEPAHYMAKCYNGAFLGLAEPETGVISFKGIPYAKAPVGELRWKAPVAAEASDDTYYATEFGDSGIQYYWFSEPITTPVSEDCLTLNVWTDDLTPGKPVMVFFPGGAYAWGSTSEEIYNGQYIVSEHPDVVVVTVNYRLGMTANIDFSSVPGGEDFPDSQELSLLDCVESLRWVKENIAAFGGDPDNVTIFGESAGGGIVSCLLASDYAGELFRRVIAESGSLRLSYTQAEYDQSLLTEALLAASGAENMDDLMALTTEELIALNEMPLDEDETTLNDLYNMPLHGGSVTKADAYAAVEAAGARGVDLLIGTTTDEVNYWLEEMAGAPLSTCSEDEVAEALFYYETYYLGDQYTALPDTYTDEQMARVEQFLAMQNTENVWALSRLFTETVFRQPAIAMAERHNAGGSGKTYMYLFGKALDAHPLLGSCHAAELPYVFHSLNCDGYGTVDAVLADKVCTAWVNFAKTGDPSTEENPWSEYDTETRLTTVIAEDGSFTVVSDPEGEARELLSFAVATTFMANGA